MATTRKVDDPREEAAREALLDALDRSSEDVTYAGFEENVDGPRPGLWVVIRRFGKDPEYIAVTRQEMKRLDVVAKYAVRAYEAQSETTAARLSAADTGRIMTVTAGGATVTGPLTALNVEVQRIDTTDLFQTEPSYTDGPTTVDLRIGAWEAQDLPGTTRVRLAPHREDTN